MLPRSNTHGNQWRKKVGVVVIGRDEGERLIACLKSLKDYKDQLVYVDSGSKDGSVEKARKLCRKTVELDPSIPFSAARARNTGFEELLSLNPELDYVQFVDGDCEVHEKWIEKGFAYLESDPYVAAVAGRRREKDPKASTYNQIADIEWNTPIGITNNVGGDALMRVKAFQKVGGYDQRFIAGEDPELCLRFRQAGYRIMRLDEEMTLHDAAIYQAKQWWRRSVRSGHAYAQLYDIHRQKSEKRRTVTSIVGWGGFVPIVGFGGAIPTMGMSLFLLSGYAVLWKRIQRHYLNLGYSSDDSKLYASSVVIGRIAEFQGLCQYGWNRYIRKQATGLIEYKGQSYEKNESNSR